MIQLNRNPGAFVGCTIARAFLSVALVCFLGQQLRSQEVQPANNCAPIERILPPLGIDIDKDQRSQWLSKVEAIDAQTAMLPDHRRADVLVLTKACRLAIEFRELYQPKDASKSIAYSNSPNRD